LNRNLRIPSKAESSDEPFKWKHADRMLEFKVRNAGLGVRRTDMSIGWWQHKRDPN